VPVFRFEDQFIHERARYASDPGLSPAWCGSCSESVTDLAGHRDPCSGPWVALTESVALVDGHGWPHRCYRKHHRDRHRFLPPRMRQDPAEQRL